MEKNERTVRKNNVDMLNGPLGKKMWLFALPLIASGLLQQSFNAVDVAVAGRFAGSHALASVGANGPVLGLMVNLFLGLAIGLNVVIANHIGAGDSRGVRDAVAASMPLALVSSLLLVVLGEMLGKPMLELLSTPEEIMGEALEYLRILVAGFPCLIVYNFAAAILRSVGDTRRPFYALVVSGILNVALNLIFIQWFGMGVAGVAWATVISTGVNALIVVGILVRERGDIRLDFKSFGRGLSQIRRICHIGIPAGLQSTVFAFSNVFVLSAINTFGSSAIAGSAAAVNFEFVTYFVINAFGQTAVAFVGQNYGARQYDRCRRIFHLSLVYSIVAALAMNLVIAANGNFCLGLFTDDPEVMLFAHERLLNVLIFQFIACYYEMAAQCMRGMGHSLVPAVITIFGTCVIRVLWVLFFPDDASFVALMTVYPVTWVITTLMMAGAYVLVSRKCLRANDLSVPVAGV